MTVNEKIAVGIGLNVRDNLVAKGINRDVAETLSIIAQNAAKEAAERREKIMIMQLNKIVNQFNIIAEETKQLTSANVSHKGCTIRGIAIRAAESIKKLKF
jgi:hypothetical protein